MDLKRQVEIIKNNTFDLVSEVELVAKLKKGKPLRVKLGVDPSRPDLHLGHAVVLKKLKEFQDLGHQVVLIIGDFTARIGDPSGRSATRPMLSMEEVRENAISYQEQAFTILDREKTEVRYNGEWLDKMNFEDVIRLAAKYTVARMLERDDFDKRYKDNQPISVAEFMYPLAQAYDSVAIRSDVEIGGTDQLFNLLVGRKIQADHGLEPQIVLTMPIIEGTDGNLKMSKSYDNYIAFTDEPKNVYGKVMSIPDTLMMKYYRLLTEMEKTELDAVEKGLADGSVNPRDCKMRLGRKMVELLYDEEKASEAEAEFVKVFQQKDVPTDIPVLELNSETIKLADLLVASGVQSKSEAKRLIGQGGVKINDVKFEDPFEEIKLNTDDILRIGKRRFFKVVLK
ncbi:MAG TPA: tyrosine--tRNA ligase [Thermotogota bacterium]|nr:tyrosine--tRNA ligase [Thermotogota bacterium]HPJ89200.1 tyrosine--tRNA ligase [Thermotogota bacterium]